jgi:hypothetical protein
MIYPPHAIANQNTLIVCFVLLVTSFVQSFLKLGAFRTACHSLGAGVERFLI